MLGGPVIDLISHKAMNELHSTVWIVVVPLSYSQVLLMV